MREGYKQTDVGVIPEDWEAKPIGKVCKLVNGRGFKPHEWKSEGLPIIRIQNLNGSGEFNYYQGSYDKKIEVEDGQLLFAWSGSRGTSFGPHVWKGSLGLLNYHTWKVVVNEKEIIPNYFLHALKELTKFIEGKAHGASALVHTQKWEMEGFEFPLPPTKTEQTAIANALSDADAWIQSLTRLIAKKRQIKQGAMQTLLNPYENGRLKDGWVVKQLGKIAHVEMGQSPSSKNYNTKEIGLPLVQGNADIENRETIIRTYTSEITKKCSSGDIIMSVRAPVGEIAVATFDACLGRGVCAIKYSNKYIFHYLVSIESRWGKLSTGSTFDSANSTVVKKLDISLPNDEIEQMRIAEVLTDMDVEITALETKLAKAKKIKQGMMQNLLTGRIRLI